MKQFVFSLFTYSLLLLSACAPETVSVSGITLSNSKVEFSAGGSAYIQATVIPSNATNQRVLWTSNNPNVIVDGGRISGNKEGVAIVTAITEDGGKTATCEVIVLPIPVENVKIDKSVLFLLPGEKSELAVSISPERASNKEVMWSSSNNNVAVVADGIVTAIHGGSAIITVTTVSEAKSATCEVNVSSVPAVDLGLSVMWAEYNVGATKPEEFGDFFAWGETEPYYSSLNPLIWKVGKEAGYDWPSYKWCGGAPGNYTKYGGTNYRTRLDASDDVATVKYGERWRTPQDKELSELVKKCTINSDAECNGVKGCRFTSTVNGNSIFLPYSGGWRGNRNIGGGADARYWSSSNSILSGMAYALHIEPKTKITISPIYFEDGYAVRPVCD